MAPIELFEREAGRQREVADLETLLLSARVATRLKRAVDTRQKSGATSEAVFTRDSDVAGEFAAGPELVLNDRAHLRVIDHRRGCVTGVEMVGGERVVGDFSDDAADHGDLVGDAGQLRQVVAEHIARLRLHHAERATVFDRCLGLGVERLVVGKATRQVDLDDALDPLRKLPLREIAAHHRGLTTGRTQVEEVGE